MTAPESLCRITRSGTWGDAARACAEKGKEYLAWASEAVLSLLGDIDRSFDELPVR